jgi:Leucine-rich repeat (LRR) protein
MGSNNSTPAKGKHVLATKLATAEKTGILNLADQDLKASSPVWDKIQSQGLVERIKTLDISGNTLKYLPAEILSMLILKVLHASRCNIQRTYDMTSMGRLVTLSLDGNDLEANMLAQLPMQLQRLNLSSNHFLTIPNEGFAGLVNLRELNLSNNRLNSTVGIGILVALIDLNLDNNNISEVSEDLSSCVVLKHLSLKSNKLSGKAADGRQSIPSRIFTDTLLDEIVLSGNAMLSRAMVWAFDGVDVFVARRKQNRDRNLAGGAGAQDLNIFGDLL